MESCAAAWGFTLVPQPPPKGCAKSLTSRSVLNTVDTTCAIYSRLTTINFIFTHPRRSMMSAIAALCNQVLAEGSR
jgi:hypothetical protein